MPALKFWKFEAAKFDGSAGTCQCKHSASVPTTLCLAFQSDEQTLLSGGIDGSIHIWRQARLVSIVSAHVGPVFSIGCSSNLVALGGADGLHLWDGNMLDEATGKVKSSFLSCDVVASGLGTPTTVRSIAISEKGKESAIFVGTEANELYKVPPPCRAVPCRAVPCRAVPCRAHVCMFACLRVCVSVFSWRGNSSLWPPDDDQQWRA